MNLDLRVLGAQLDAAVLVTRAARPGVALTSVVEQWHGLIEAAATSPELPDDSDEPADHEWMGLSSEGYMTLFGPSIAVTASLDGSHPRSMRVWDETWSAQIDWGVPGGAATLGSTMGSVLTNSPGVARIRVADNMLLDFDWTLSAGQGTDNRDPTAQLEEARELVARSIEEAVRQADADDLVGSRTGNVPGGGSPSGSSPGSGAAGVGALGGAAGAVAAAAAAAAATLAARKLAERTGATNDHAQAATPDQSEHPPAPTGAPPTPTPAEVPRPVEPAWQPPTPAESYQLCPICQAPLRPHAHFCPRCGARVAAESGWHPTHRTDGTPQYLWEVPDPSAPPLASLRPWLDVEVLQVQGAWCEIRLENGWTGWADLRRLAAR